MLACALLGALVLTACGGPDGDAYGCSSGVCTATFSDAGKQDLSDDLGAGATLQLEDVTGQSATVTVGGRDAKLEVGKAQQVGDFLVTLQKVDGDGATLKLRRAA